MKSFLKFALSALALGVIASIPSLQAQDAPKKGKGGRGAMSPDAMVARLDEAVTLTADQKAKATDIYTKEVADMQALAPEDRRSKGQEIRDAANKDIRALLTPDQQTKFDAMPPPGKGGRKKKDQ